LVISDCGFQKAESMGLREASETSETSETGTRGLKTAGRLQQELLDEKLFTINALRSRGGVYPRPYIIQV
jgi:hypothetical protein